MGRRVERNMFVGKLLGSFKKANWTEYSNMWEAISYIVGENVVEEARRIARDEVEKALAERDAARNKELKSRRIARDEATRDYLEKDAATVEHMRLERERLREIMDSLRDNLASSDSEDTNAS